MLNHINKLVLKLITKLHFQLTLSAQHIKT